jgi:hypothetical protein
MATSEPSVVVTYQLHRWRAVHACSRHSCMVEDDMDTPSVSCWCSCCCCCCCRELRSVANPTARPAAVAMATTASEAPTTSSPVDDTTESRMAHPSQSLRNRPAFTTLESGTHEKFESLLVGCQLLRVPRQQRLVTSTRHERVGHYCGRARRRLVDAR